MSTKSIYRLKKQKLSLLKHQIEDSPFITFVYNNPTSVHSLHVSDVLVVLALQGKTF